MQYKSLYKSPCGTIILTSDGIYLTGLWFKTTRFLSHQEVKAEEINDQLEVFQKKWLKEYFNGYNPNTKGVPFKLVGTVFSLMVWEELKKIPYGSTITYGEIANKIVKNKNIKKMSAKAVGHAVGINPISIIVPCH